MKYRKQLLQHRISCEAKFLNGKETIAGIKTPKQQSRVEELTRLRKEYDSELTKTLADERKNVEILEEYYSIK